MICPNCNKEMKIRERSVPISLGYGGEYDDPEDWDDNYSDTEIIRTHKCKECKISYEEKDDVWTIPKEYAPTEKQEKTALFIINRLKCEMPPPHKKSYWKFINEHFERAKQVQEQMLDDYYYENHDWLEEEF